MINVTKAKFSIFTKRNGYIFSIWYNQAMDERVRLGTSLERKWPSPVRMRHYA